MRKLLAQLKIVREFELVPGVRRSVRQFHDALGNRAYAFYSPGQPKQPAKPNPR